MRFMSIRVTFGRNVISNDYPGGKLDAFAIVPMQPDNAVYINQWRQMKKA